MRLACGTDTLPPPSLPRLMLLSHRYCRVAFALTLLVSATPCVLRAQTPVLTVQQSGTSSLLQAVSVSSRDPNVVWISGHAGTYARTRDGGATWSANVVPGVESLQFRDLHAVDAQRAWLMAAGNGEKSAIFQTRDGGASWTPAFINRDSSAFFDCMAFFDDRRGFAFSDAVNGRTPIVYTDNGNDWSLTSVPSLPNEGGFAASGLCAITTSKTDAWIASGAGPSPRVRHSTDRGRTWTDVVVPLAAGASAGATAVAFRDAVHGVVVGGVIGGEGTGARVARTSDGGQTWVATQEPPFAGAIYGATYARTGSSAVLIAVGPGGAAWSANDGDTWTMLDAAPYWSVGVASNGTTWLVGPKGRVVRVDWR
jgi:photosystem II stability/assembly factor-like uncharacterized protein